jgi:hypothetical protein
LVGVLRPGNLYDFNPCIFQRLSTLHVGVHVFSTSVPKHSAGFNVNPMTVLACKEKVSSCAAPSTREIALYGIKMNLAIALGMSQTCATVNSW